MKAIKKILISFSFILTLFMLCGCNAPYQKNNEKMVVVTTIFPYYDFVRELGTSDIELHLLITPGMDSHSYEPTPSDLILLQNADLLIYNGGEAEVWVEEILQSIDTSNLSTLCMMDYVELMEEEHDEEHHHHDHDETCSHEESHSQSEHASEIVYDEHIWTSPKNAILIVEAIKNRLCEIDGSHIEEYEANYESYRLELAKLDQAFEDTVKNAKTNVIVVGDKFPFQYFVTHYGLEHYAAFPACSSEVEPSVKTMISLVDTMKSEHLGTVFYTESTNNTKVTATICEETGADSLLLHSCHTVTNQELKDGISYVSIMWKNVKALQKGLNTP
ncbi:MAG: zinc ABC transporter substrate-binding protein [Lachnospiraceae bacterium]|nr:zinc ABC transporter substrate-binding protein [Lachnospiraceae bacterium]